MKRGILFVLTVLMAMAPLNAMAGEAKMAYDYGPYAYEEDAAVPVTLSVFIDAPGPRFKGWGQDDVTRYITEQTGVSLDIVWATTDDSQQLSTMIAGGTLPDILVFDHTSAIYTILWKQGYLTPVNQLIGQYAPKLQTIIDNRYTDMDTFYTEEDGNWYCIPQHYSCPEIEAEIPGNVTVQGALSVNRKVYEELGRPAMETWDDYVNVLLQVKEKYPDMYPAFMGDPHTPENDIYNMVQLINRCMGGKSAKVLGADGSVTLNFADETYRQAILFANELYRKGLFKADNFTCGKNNSEQFEQLVVTEKIFSYWGACMQVSYNDMSANSPYIPVEPPRSAGVTPKIKANTGTIGLSNQATAVTSACKDPRRAAEFLEFMMTYEGQMAPYHGVEGLHIEYVDGMPKATEYKLGYMDDWTNMGYETGVFGPMIFLAQLQTDAYYYYWLNADKPIYQMVTDVYQKYESVERMEDLIKVSSDSDAKIIETNVIELWVNALPKIILSNTQAEAETAYQTFVSDAERMGLAELEAAYAQNYRDWLEKLEG